MADVSLPGAGHRTTIIGRTGSGKTQFAAWLLTRQPFDKMPYVIVDYKGDDLLNSVSRIEEISVRDVPKKPGLYVVKPLPHQTIEVERMLWKFWHRENIGLFFDETTLIPESRKGSAAAAILMQGRSKRVPLIAVTQRPANIPRAYFSEADFFAVFHLNTAPDIKRIEEMCPIGTMDGLKADFRCRWYDVKRDQLSTFRPVPDADTIRTLLNDRLAPRRRVIL